MQFEHHQKYIVEDKSYISLTKREIVKFAESLGFGEFERGKIEIIVTEMASNLVKHTTKGGEILVKGIEKDGVHGIEIMALDVGPGIRDLSRMMEDGTSTYGSKGEGLGAIKRLSDFFDIYTHYGLGTILLSRLFIKVSGRHKHPIKPKLEIQAVMVPKRGETLCGDGFAYVFEADHCLILTVDGLGHGPDASSAARAAIESFKSCSSPVPSEILRQIHVDIKRTRGVVGSITNIDFKTKKLTYCGIGNISGRIISLEGTKTLSSYNGTIGFTIPTSFHDHIYSWENYPLLILHSDGIKSRWDSARCVELQRRDPTIIAGVIYLENNRGTDDTLVLAVKNLI